MRVLEPKQLSERQADRFKSRKHKKRKHVFSAMLVLVTAVYVVYALATPLPLLQANTNDLNLTAGVPVSMPWPTYGQAAVGALGYGLLDQYGEETQLPIASVAKVMTAVAILKVKPLQPGETGETVAIAPADVDVYNQYVQEGQSVVAVATGTDLTQYQALQALLLPSANNMAEILARWAFGSPEAYVAFANTFTKTLGMQNTVIADASGYNPATKSTAVDLTKLAEIAMNHPVIAEIVGQPQATLPTAGTVYNVNNFLGMDGIIGIKTGNTDEAGGCYMFAAKRVAAGGESITVVGVVIGAASRAQAMQDALPLMNETYKGFAVTQLIKTGEVLGTISQTNGKQVPLTVQQGVSVITWSNQIPKIALELVPLETAIAQGDSAGSLLVYVGDMNHKLSLVAGDTIPKHSVGWRLRHAGGYL